MLKVSVFGLFFLSSFAVKAQVSQNDVLFISDNTFMYLSPGVENYIFGTATTAKSISTRTEDDYGKLIFAHTVTHSGAYATNTTVNHFFDGYVSTLSSDDFIMPVGHLGVYAPAKVNATPTNTGVDGAYYHENPSALFSSGLGEDVVALLGTGYWNIQRASGSTADAKITLSWLSSISSLVDNLDGLSIVGHSGTNGDNWELIASTVSAGTIDGTGTSAVASGTITTDEDVDLSIYKYFTLSEKETCAPVVNAVGNPVKWNGSNWIDTVTLASVGNPTETSTAILEAPFSGNIIANSLNMGAFNVTLADGQVMEIVKSVTATTGKVIMSSNASLVQRDATATAPKIELTKNTRSLTRYDYTYFGSPVSENVFSQLAGAYYLTPTSNNRLYNHYKMISGDRSLFGEELTPANPYLTPWQTLTSGNFVAPGKGWISSIYSMAPFNVDSFSGVISLKFSGTANNGDISTSVVISPETVPTNSASANHGSNYNLLANPYPSALSADKFVDENVDVDGVVYIWEAKTGPAITGIGYYQQADYIHYTKAGSTVPTVGTPTFNGKIASAQGFMIRALNNGTAVFNNCMRLSGSADNNSFFRTTSTLSTQNDREINRYKLNLTSSTGDFNQVLVAYIDGLTTGYDRAYDAMRNSNSNSKLFTIIPSTNDKLAIDARPTFTDEDVVPLGFSSSAPLASTAYQINVVQKEGIFTNDDLNIYIHDSVNNTYHNFDNGTFNFTANQTELLNRFSIVYQSSTLGSNEFNDSGVNVGLNNNNLLLNSKEYMETAYVFDVTGRLVQKFDINGLTFSNDFNHAQGVYIVRVNLSNGKSVSNKVINN